MTYAKQTPKQFVSSPVVRPSRPSYPVRPQGHYTSKAYMTPVEEPVASQAGCHPADKTCGLAEVKAPHSPYGAAGPSFGGKGPSSFSAYGPGQFGQPYGPYGFTNYYGVEDERAQYSLFRLGGTVENLSETVDSQALLIQALQAQVQTLDILRINLTNQFNALVLQEATGRTYATSFYQNLDRIDFSINVTGSGANQSTDLSVIAPFGVNAGQTVALNISMPIIIGDSGGTAQLVLLRDGVQVAASNLATAT